MKLRILTLAMSAVMALSLLAGCSPKEPPTKDVNVDLEEFYTSITQQHEMQMGMDQLPDDMIENYFPGLEDIATDQRVLRVSMVTMNTQEIALVKVTNEGDVDTVKQIFQDRIDQQAEGGAWYPAAMEAWAQNSKVEAQGNYVIMVVHEDKDAIIDEFNALFQ